LKMITQRTVLNSSIALKANRKIEARANQGE
jgi:hypothetical protein